MPTTLQQHIIETLHAKADIDPKQEIRNRIDFLKAFTRNAGTKGFVLGISGGQDSSLAGKLCQLAVDELNAEGYAATFIAMRLPYGVQQDEEDAQRALAFIKPDQSVVFNIKAGVDAAQAEYNTMGLGDLTDYHKGNIKARVRMLAQYAVAGGKGLLVVGTDQNVELCSGFFTLAGDGAADILPISALNKRQGKALLIELYAPKEIYLKTPTADLLDDVVGQPDETELGVTYNQLDDYLEGKNVSEENSAIIEARYLKTEHKRQLPTSINDVWWK
jgi:NAD+ synthase